MPKVSEETLVSEAYPSPFGNTVELGLVADQSHTALGGWLNVDGVGPKGNATAICALPGDAVAAAVLSVSCSNRRQWSYPSWAAPPRSTTEPSRPSSSSSECSAHRTAHDQRPAALASHALVDFHGPCATLLAVAATSPRDCQRLHPLSTWWQRRRPSTCRPMLLTASL